VTTPVRHCDRFADRSQSRFDQLSDAVLTTFFRPSAGPGRLGWITASLGAQGDHNTMNAASGFYVDFCRQLERCRRQALPIEVVRERDERARVDERASSPAARRRRGQAIVR